MKRYYSTTYQNRLGEREYAVRDRTRGGVVFIARDPKRVRKERDKLNEAYGEYDETHA